MSSSRESYDISTNTDPPESGKSGVVCIFKSGRKEHSKILKTTVHQFRKWSFLMTSKEPKRYLKQKLEDIKTDISLKISQYCVAVEFSSMYQEEKFENWIEKCFDITENCFRDLELLHLNGPLNDIQHLYREMRKSNLIENDSVSVFELRDTNGVFILGRGENIFDLILDMQTHMKSIYILRTETIECILFTCFSLSPSQFRLNRVFKGMEKTMQVYPYIKLYQHGMKVKLIANEKDSAAASKYLKANSWMTGIHTESCKELDWLAFFLGRKNVQEFIDTKIASTYGTWALMKSTDPQFGEVPFMYGKTKHDIEKIRTILTESITTKKYSVVYSKSTEEVIQKWKANAEHLEKNFQGKFNLQIKSEEKSGLINLEFTFTSDLEGEKSLKTFVYEVELRVPKKELIQLKHKHIIWLKKYHLNSLQSEAKKSDIYLNFVLEKNAVEIAGPSSELTGIERLIQLICPIEQNILLLFAALPSKVTDFLSEYQCCFAYSPFKNSRLWIKGTTGIIVYKGESGSECLYSDVQVRAVESEEKDMVIEWVNDQKTALLKFPIWREGGTREINQIEEVLQLLFTEVKKQNKKYVAFDLQDLAFWPMKMFVKSIIDCVPKPPEGLIIWISHPDENAFQTAISCLKEAEFTKTGGDIKSSKIELKVVKGRIAKLQEKVDVIVNTTSLSLDMTSGAVSKSILEAAGDELKIEIAQIPVDRTTGQVIRVNYGDVAETFGYRLNCERIFYGALYKWKDDQEKALDVLQQFVRNCITLADKREFKTLAFPAIGTGQLKIPSVLVATSVKRIVEEYAASNNHKHVEKIVFVIHEKDEENFKVFRTILEHENAAWKTNETPEIPVLYRFSVYGEEQNVVGAMNILAGMFREHVNEKYKLAMSQEGETKDSNQQKDVHVQPVVKTNGFAISQSPATVSSAEENKFAISYAEQLCLLLQSKEKMALTEQYLGPVLKDSNCENIICPFLEEESALIKFKTTNDADKFFGRFENEKYALRKLYIQAVTNIKAKLSSKVISILKGKGITSEEFNRKTGAYLSTDTWRVEGSLLMVQNGERLIKELVVKECEASNFSAQNRNRSANNLDSTPDIDLLRKYSIPCKVYEEKALRELFTSTELPFSNVNIVDVIAGQKMISGTQKNVNPFEKALAELKCQEISEISLIEFQDFEKKKLENVSVSFDEKRQTMIIISRSPESLKRSIEEFRRIQDDHLVLREEEFYLIIFFEKSLSQDFPKIDGKIMVKGPKSFVNKYRLALDNLKKYPVQSVTITDRVLSEAEIFISRFSSENKNVYIQMKDNKISITGKKTDKVLLAKQKLDEQIEIMRKRNIGLASNGSDQIVKSGVPYVNLVSPKETDIVFQKSNVRVYVLKANILQVKADAIVNPMSTDLSHCILREAGSSVQSQSSEVLDSKRNNIFQIGEAFVTDGGNLSHLLKIIHVNVPNWNNYAELEVGSPCEKCIEDIAETVKVSLEKGNDNNVCAIAIPPISKCGVGSVPLPVCGRAYVSAVTSYIDAYPKSSTNKIREIYFVDTDQTKLDAIKFAFSGFQHWVFLQADNEEHFYHGGGTVVKIFASEILFADAEALVAPQEGEMKSERYIAKSLKRCECKAYDEEIAKFYGCTWRVGDIRTTSAPKSLKFYNILHVYSPSWRSDVSLNVKIKDLRTCIQNVFKEASKLKLCTIAIPTFGGGIIENINRQRIFKETARAIVECLGRTPNCTVRVISIIDSNELNIALMILQFYEILSQDGKVHNTDFINVQKPNL